MGSSDQLLCLPHLLSFVSLPFLSLSSHFQGRFWTIVSVSFRAGGSCQSALPTFREEATQAHFEAPATSARNRIGLWSPCSREAVAQTLRSQGRVQKVVFT